MSSLSPDLNRGLTLTLAVQGRPSNPGANYCYSDLRLISYIYINSCIVIFVRKNARVFRIAKDSHFFKQKVIVYLIDIL